MSDQPKPDDRVRAAARANPVRASNGLVGAVAALGTALAMWGIDSLPAAVPGDVEAQLAVVATLVGGGLGAAVGAWVQKRFTWPQDWLDHDGK